MPFYLFFIFIKGVNVFVHKLIIVFIIILVTIELTRFVVFIIILILEIVKFLTIVIILKIKWLIIKRFIIDLLFRLFLLLLEWFLRFCRL